MFCFKISEPLYDKWLQTIAQTTVIHQEEGEEEIRLGAHRAHPTFNKLQLRVFERFQHDDQLVVIGTTPLSAGIWRANCAITTDRDGIPPPRFLAEELDGLFFIIDKLCIQWIKSTGKPSMDR